MYDAAGNRLSPIKTVNLMQVFARQSSDGVEVTNITVSVSVRFQLQKFEFGKSYNEILT